MVLLPVMRAFLAKQTFPFAGKQHKLTDASIDKVMHELNPAMNSATDNGLITFEPFIGVRPRRFLDLFSMSLGSGSKLKRKDKAGSTLDWSKSTAPIRTPLISKSYLEIESSAADIWDGN